MLRKLVCSILNLKLLLIKNAIVVNFQVSCVTSTIGRAYRHTCMVLQSTFGLISARAIFLSAPSPAPAGGVWLGPFLGFAGLSGLASSVLARRRKVCSIDCASCKFAAEAVGTGN